MTTQQDINTEGGDFAGRDLDKREYHFHNTESALFLHPYLEIVKKLNNGYEVDIDEQIEDLEHYNGVIRDDQRGLEKKLIDSQREYLIKNALRNKSKASRLITKHQDSPAFQFLIAKVLARIEVTFDYIIRPMIQNDASIQDVDTAILKEVINPIQQLLIGTPLGANSECVLHLLYFLAGNCHICWDKKC